MEEALVDIQRRVDLTRALNDEREEINRARRLALESRRLDAAETLVGDTPPSPLSALDVLAGCASATIQDDVGNDETLARGTHHNDAGDPTNIGKRVKVWWEGEGRSFSGAVVDTCPEKGARVRYDDRDVQWEQKIVLLRSYLRNTHSDKKQPIVKGKRLRTPPAKLGVNDGWGSAVARSWSSHA